MTPFAPPYLAEGPVGCLCDGVLVMAPAEGVAARVAHPYVIPDKSGILRDFTLYWRPQLINTIGQLFKT